MCSFLGAKQRWLFIFGMSLVYAFSFTLLEEGSCDPLSLMVAPRVLFLPPVMLLPKELATSFLSLAALTFRAHLKHTHNPTHITTPFAHAKVFIPTKQRNFYFHSRENHWSNGAGKIARTTHRSVQIDACQSSETGAANDSFTSMREEPSVEEDDFATVAEGKGKLESGLYLVATPIGNLEDVTLRALRVLRSADLILTEDTRHAAKLLQHYGIRTPTVSYHKFNETSRESFVLERLQEGQILALISDAGTPGISDPGADLVAACVGAKIHVYPIPGPSAAIAALVGAGLPTTEFSFVGFLSTQASVRQKRLMAAAAETATQIIYVPPHKLCKVLEDCVTTFGSSRRCVVAREITKIHEEFWRGTLEEARLEFSSRNPRGEITLVIEGLQNSSRNIPTDEELESELRTFLAHGRSVSEAAKLVAQEKFVRKKVVYDLALKLSKQMQGSKHST